MSADYASSPVFVFACTLARHFEGSLSFLGNKKLFSYLVYKLDESTHGSRKGNIMAVHTGRPHLLICTSKMRSRCFQVTEVMSSIQTYLNQQAILYPLLLGHLVKLRAWLVELSREVRAASGYAT